MRSVEQFGGSPRDLRGDAIGLDDQKHGVQQPRQAEGEARFAGRRHVEHDQVEIDRELLDRAPNSMAS